MWARCCTRKSPTNASTLSSLEVAQLVVVPERRRRRRTLKQRSCSSASLVGICEVVLQVSWLNEDHTSNLDRIAKVSDVALSKQRTHDQDYVENEHRKVQDRKANYTAFPKFALLKRVDWRADLTAAKRISKSFQAWNGDEDTYLGRSQNSMIE